MKRLTGLLLALAALVLAAPAAAEPFTPEADADYAFALQYWGASPSSCSTVTRSLVSAEALEDPSHLGRATLPPPGQLSPCALDVLAGLEPCVLVGVVVHETGHLLGLGHSVDPLSPMAPASQSQRHWCRDEDSVRYRREVRAWRARCSKLTGARAHECWSTARTVNLNLVRIMAREESLAAVGL